MRVLLLLGSDSTAARLADAVALRGHELARLAAAAADADPVTKDLASVDVVIADVEIAANADLARRIVASSPGVELILAGARPAVAQPAEVMAHVEHPIDVDQVLGYIDEVADILDGQRKRQPIDLVDHDTLFAGDSPPLAALLRRVRLVARSHAPVWIYGDDGSGRSVVARAIHDRSNGRNTPFIAYNTAAYPDDELARLLKQASGCTLFLEQITTAGPQTQRELIQLLERKPDDEHPGVRLIVGVQTVDASATAQRVLSAELYYGLKVLEVEVPRLRDRARDLGPIVERMLARLAVDGDAAQISTEALRLLERYSFPGNFLELAHALTHAFVVAHGAAIEPQHLPPSVRQTPAASHGSEELESLDTVAKRFERDYLLRVLRSVGGSRGQAAEILGLSRKGLWGKLKAHGISDDDIDDDAAAAGEESDIVHHGRKS